MEIKMLNYSEIFLLILLTLNYSIGLSSSSNDLNDLNYKTEFFKLTTTKLQSLTFTPPPSSSSPTTLSPISSTSSSSSSTPSTTKSTILNLRIKKNIDYKKIHLINLTSTNNNYNLNNNYNSKINFYYNNNINLNKNLSDILLLNLSNKNLNTTNKNLINLINLNNLDLSNNNLKIFNLNFNKLKILNLNNNFLIKFTDNLINTNIEEIYLSCNKLNNTKQLNFSSNKLEILDISCNLIKNLSEKFFYETKNLKILNLSCNKIEKIPKNLFQNLLKLEKLNLSLNNISVIINETFLNLLNLQQLDLSYNDLRPQAIRSLQVIPNLMDLSVAYNYKLGNALQGFVASWSLRELDASGTGLMKIPSALTQSVRILKLKHNYFEMIHCGDLDSYPLLQYLILSSCHIKDIEDDALGRLEILYELYLDHNNLSRIPISLPSNLEHLYLQHNKIMDVQETAFTQLINLKILDLSGNHITYLPELKLQKLISLNLKSTKLKGISQNIIKSSPNLKELNLENNPVKCSDLFVIAEWVLPCRDILLFDDNNDFINNNYNNNKNNTKTINKNINLKCSKCLNNNNYLHYGDDNDDDGNGDDDDDGDDDNKSIKYEKKLISFLNLKGIDENQQQLASSVKTKSEMNIHQKSITNKIEIGLTTTANQLMTTEQTSSIILTTRKHPKSFSFVPQEKITLNFPTTTSTPLLQNSQTIIIKTKTEKLPTKMPNNKIILNKKNINITDINFLKQQITTENDAKVEILKDIQTNLSQIKSKDEEIIRTTPSSSIVASPPPSSTTTPLHQEPTTIIVIKEIKNNFILPKNLQSQNNNHNHNNNNNNDDSSNLKKFTTASKNLMMKPMKNNLSGKLENYSQNKIIKIPVEIHKDEKDDEIFIIETKTTTTTKSPNINLYKTKNDNHKRKIIINKTKNENYPIKVENRNNNTTELKENSLIKLTTTKIPTLFELLSLNLTSSDHHHIIDKNLNLTKDENELNRTTTNYHLANNNNQNNVVSYSTLPERWNEIRTTNNRHSGTFIIVGATIGILLTITLAQIYRCIKPKNLTSTSSSIIFNRNQNLQDDEHYNSIRRDLLPMESLNLSSSSTIRILSPTPLKTITTAASSSSTSSSSSFNSSYLPPNTNITEYW